MPRCDHLACPSVPDAHHVPAEVGGDITVAADMILSVEKRVYEYGFVILRYQPTADHLHGA